MAKTTPDPERARRLRAARAYRGLKAPDLAEKLQISVETLSRMENARIVVDDARGEQYMDACKVPRWFLHLGFEIAPESEDPVYERLEALETQMITVLRIIGTRTLASATTSSRGRPTENPGENGAQGLGD